MAINRVASAATAAPVAEPPPADPEVLVLSSYHPANEWTGEVLRGLLNDDPKERWMVSDLMYWSHGRRQNPKPQAIPRKANRPFVFDGNEYQTTRDLAHAFVNNWDAAITPIKDGSLNIWLRRGFSDEEKADRFYAQYFTALRFADRVRIADGVCVAIGHGLIGAQ